MRHIFILKQLMNELSGLDANKAVKMKRHQFLLLSPLSIIYIM